MLYAKIYNLFTKYIFKSPSKCHLKLTKAYTKHSGTFCEASKKSFTALLPLFQERGLYVTVNVWIETKFGTTIHDNMEPDLVSMNKQILNKMKYTDVVIKPGSGAVVPCHRIFLAGALNNFKIQIVVFLFLL